MRSQELPSDVANLIDQDEPTSPAGALESVRASASEARELELEIVDLKERLAYKNQRLNEILSTTLVDLMDRAKVDSVGVLANGNSPAFDVLLKMRYRASIAAEWPEEKRARAFQVLEDYDAADLIKTTVEVAFNREDRVAAKKFVDELAKKKGKLVTVRVKESVHHGTLTAWLKEQSQAGNPLPPLDDIGGFAGRVAELKVRKNDD